MKQLRVTLLVSYFLIGLGAFIILQSEYAPTDYQPVVSIHSVKADVQIPTLAFTYAALPPGWATTDQTAVIEAENSESTPLNTRETRLVIRKDQWQAGLMGEVPAESWRESTKSIGTGSGGNIPKDQISNMKKTAKTTLDSLFLAKLTAGEPTEAQPELQNTFEPVRLTGPHAEVAASDWLVNGDENGVREDPVPFIWPAEKTWLSGYNFSLYHPGIDIAANTGDMIFAAASGKVIAVNYSNRGYGNMVIVNHLNGYQTLYAHLSTILTEMGSYVIQGQPIGLAGSTGNSTGSHLHFEIHDQGRYVNPWLFLTR